MTRKSYKRGEVARRVYKLLHRNPDLTSKEVAAQMPDVPKQTVYSNISRMAQEGKLASRGTKSEVGPNGYSRTHKTHHVKYNTTPKRKPKPKPKPKDRMTSLNPKVKDRMQPTPVVETPEEIAARAAVEEMLRDWAADEMDAPPMEPPKVVNIRPEPEGPTTPTAEREVLIMRHLTDIYRGLNLLTEQQDALIEVLKGTLADLAETKDELDRERQRRNWWDKIKDLFA